MVGLIRNDDFYDLFENREFGRTQMKMFKWKFILFRIGSRKCDEVLLEYIGRVMGGVGGGMISPFPFNIAYFPSLSNALLCKARILKLWTNSVQFLLNSRRQFYNIIICQHCTSLSAHEL